MDFNQAVEAHRQWKIRLRMFVSGSGEKLDAPKIERDDQCDLGKWVQSERARLSKSPQFQQLVAQHAAFHRCAANIVRAAVAGKKAEAQALLAEDGDFARCSVQTVRAINALAHDTAA